MRDIFELSKKITFRRVPYLSLPLQMGSKPSRLEEALEKVEGDYGLSLSEEDWVLINAEIARPIPECPIAKKEASRQHQLWTEIVSYNLMASGRAIERRIENVYVDHILASAGINKWCAAALSSDRIYEREAKMFEKMLEYL
jgi:hypothetical protein